MHGYLGGKGFGSENKTQTSILILVKHLYELEGKFKVVSQKKSVTRKEKIAFDFPMLNSSHTAHSL